MQTNIFAAVRIRSQLWYYPVYPETEKSNVILQALLILIPIWGFDEIKFECSLCDNYFVCNTLCLYFSMWLLPLLSSFKPFVVLWLHILILPCTWNSFYNMVYHDSMVLASSVSRLPAQQGVCFSLSSPLTRVLCHYLFLFQIKYF